MPRRTRVIAVGVPHHITHHGNNRQDVFLTDDDRHRYQDLLIEAVEAREAELLRRATASGAAFGEPGFVNEPERCFGQDLGLRPRGQPQKTSAAAGTA